MDIASEIAENPRPSKTVPKESRPLRLWVSQGLATTTSIRSSQRSKKRVAIRCDVSQAGSWVNTSGVTRDGLPAGRSRARASRGGSVHKKPPAGAGGIRVSRGWWFPSRMPNRTNCVPLSVRANQPHAADFNSNVKPRIGPVTSTVKPDVSMLLYRFGMLLTASGTLSGSPNELSGTSGLATPHLYLELSKLRCDLLSQFLLSTWHWLPPSVCSTPRISLWKWCRLRGAGQGALLPFHCTRSASRSRNSNGESSTTSLYALLS